MFQAIYKNVFRAGVWAACVMPVFSACKKEGPAEVYPASFTIVNAVNDNSSYLRTYFGETQPKIYARLASIINGRSLDYATDKMNLPVRLYRNDDTLKSDQPFLQNRLTLEPGGIFTHFVYGSPARVQQKTVKEKLPSRSLNDSVVNLRIINLFENRAVDVIQLEPVPGTMVTNLAYEQLSDFMKVPANASVKNFRFEIKDHATGATLATMSETNIYPGTIIPNAAWLFKARTMLVTGTWTGAGNFSARATSIGHF